MLRNSSSLFMWMRCTAVALGRPFGPGSERPGVEYRRTVPYRSEVTMIRMAKKTTFNCNIREAFKANIFESKILAIPRDLGELPRNYAVKILLLNQPLKLLDWWELCKARDDCPLDSGKHLREVMKIARLQNWVYAEKNQTNNLWYYYVHPKRTHEVQRMIRADAESAKESAKEEATAAEARAEVDRREADEALNANIVALQNQLVANLARINEFDPDYVRGRPEMTPAGGVNVTWYRGESPHAQVEAGTTSNGSQP